jgi:tripartite ATP-independent transporter DctM subunit
MPVSIAMALSGFAGLVIKLGLAPAFEVAGKELHGQFMSYTMSVVPMFVWMGYIAYHSGIGKGLFAFFNKLVGHRRGGLLFASTLASAAFGAICGSPTAAVATMGTISFPETQRYRYNPSLSAASIAASGTLSVLIPPSLAFIVYGIQTEQSIGALFLAGVFPGLLLMVAFIVAIHTMVRINPDYAPEGERATWKEKLKASVGTIDIIVIFLAVLGGLFLGWFTPTEAGAVGAAAVLVASLIKRTLTWKAFLNSIKDTVKTTAMVMMLIFGAQIIGRLITVSEIAPNVANWLGGLPVPRLVVLLIVMFICVILGFFIEVLSLTLIAVPVLYPLIVNVLGYDPIWFGIIWVLVTSTGALTPPVGLQVYISSEVCKVPVNDVFKGVWPFVLATLVAVAIMIAFPQIVTFLPNILMKR